MEERKRAEILHIGHWEKVWTPFGLAQNLYGTVFLGDEDIPVIEYTDETTSGILLGGFTPEELEMIAREQESGR